MGLYLISAQGEKQTQNRGILIQGIGCKSVGKSRGKKRRWLCYLAVSTCRKRAFPVKQAQTVKISAYNVGDPDSIPGSEKSPGEGNGNPLQYSYLENPMDREAWQAIVHGVTKNQTRLRD